MVRLKGSIDKTRRKYVNSFARQYLKDHKIEIFCGDERILKPIKEKLYNIKLPNTRYYIGEQFIDESEIKKITRFDELRDLGFVIISEKISPEYRWETGQKVRYIIKRKNETGKHLNKIPTDHYVEYDAFNKLVRLIGPRSGPNGYGNVVRLEEKREGRYGSGQKVNLRNYTRNAERLMKEQINRIKNEEEKPKPVYISEVAFMITDSNEIVCFPNTPDMPSILITGMKRTGKCIVQDQNSDFVLDSYGNWNKISNKPSKVLTLNKEMKLVTSKVNKYFSRYVEEVIEVKTRYHKINITPEHPLLTVSGWKQIKNLKKGDFIASPRKYDLNLKKKIEKEKVEILGYLIAAGKLDKNDIRVWYKYNDYDVIKDFKDILYRFDKKLYLRRRKILSKGKNKLKEYLNEIGILGLNKQEKIIPNEIMGLHNDQIKIFVSKFFSIKGHIREKNLVLYSDSEAISRQIQHLYLRFNIRSTVNKKKVDNSIVYDTTIRGIKDICRFYDNFMPIPKYKIRKLMKEKYYAKKRNISNATQDIIPKEIWKLSQPKDWHKVYQQLGYYLKRSQIDNLNFSITRANLKKVVIATKDPIFKKFAESDIIWDKIMSIKRKKGKFKVWDLEVDNPEHNFIANDIIVHNSFCLHSLVSRFFWKPSFGYKIAILNDSSRETGTWCLPNKDVDQINILRRLNERPLPLPCVYLHPIVKEDYEKLYMGNVGFDVTIPFKEIIRRHKDYLNLKDTTRYFTKMVDELIDCKTENEVNRILDTMKISGVPPQSANKISAEFETLFDSKLTDISTENQEPWRTSKNIDKKYNPFTAIIHAGVLPILETEYISNYRELLNIYFTYFVSDLFNRQKQDIDFLKELAEMLFVVDEVHNISQKAMRSGADFLLRRCVREGGPRRIGTLLATQKFSELPDVIKDNTTYLLCFKNPGEAASIANQYSMGANRATEIKELGKHEILAYTTEKFIIYDSNGKRRESKLNEVFKGKTLPPYSMHKRPKSK